MDYYFNKTLNFQKVYQEDLNKLTTTNPSFQKSLPKSKSSNELVVKKQEKENISNNVFVNTWGFNRNGQLANSSSLQKTSQLNLIKNLNDKPIFVSAGENHTAILTNKLKLYMSGSNSFGQLGIEEVVNTLKPTILPSLNHLEIISVTCGADFTYALTSRGEVYSWGSNFKGQLGHGDFENRFSPTFVSSLTPFGAASSKNSSKNQQSSHKRNKSSNATAYQKFREKSHSVDFNNTNDQILKKVDESKILLEDNERVLTISCGALHTLVKTDKNRLFSCGFGETYALGNGDTKNCPDFEQVNFIKTNTSRPNYQKAEEIEKIACGLTHSGCIRSGKIYLWGLYSHKDSSVLKIPTVLEFNASASGRKSENDYFIDLALGDALSVFLNSKGECYTLGENIDGQLGIPNVSSTEYPLKVSQLPIAINQIACGRNHVFAFNTDLKQVYGWGSNVFGQLSLKNKGQNVFSPRQITPLCEMDIFRITCGSFHSVGLSYMPSPIDNEENDLQSDDEKNAPSNASTTIDFQKQQEDTEKLKIELEKLKAKNHYLNLENEKLRNELQSRSDIVLKSSKRNCEVAIQVNFEEKKSANRRDKSPDPKPQRVLHPQVEIDFKEITLEKQISEGGYGLIYKGRWRETVVAVKMLKMDMKEEHVRDFIYECYTMESLRHPNIVMFLGACTKPPNLAIVLEYCSRGSLWSILQNPDLKLSWDDRRRMAVDAARGVNYLHSFPTPVLHRDLKSLNLLLDENFRVKVADFGWTRTMASTMTGKIGTYQWMAPEVISGHNYTEKADVFSFGIVLWEIASREPPYRNINGVQVSIEVVQNDLRPNIPKKTPEMFQRLMRKCWDRDPNKRPTFIEIIKELETMKFEYA